MNARIIKIQLVIFLLPWVSGANAQKPLQDTVGKDTVHVLKDVSVVAYRIRGKLHTIPGSLSVVSGDELQVTGGTNFSDAINTAPGISMQTGTFATSRIVIRGMGSRTPYNTNRIRAYLNEIPLTDADGVSAPEEIDLQNLDRIEVIKGPSSALYGSGLGGSINLYTPESKTNRAVLNNHVESFGTFRNHISGTLNHGNSSSWGSISQLSSKGYRENNDYNRVSVLATSGLEQARWSLNTTMLFAAVRGGIPSSLGITLFDNNPRAAAPSWKAIRGFQEYKKGLAAVSLTNTISIKTTNQVMFFGKFNDDYEKRPFNNLDDGSLSIGLRNKFAYHSSKFDLVAGGEWINEQYKWSLNLNDSLLNKNRESRKQLNIFTVLYYHPDSKLNISLAGALNYVSFRLSDLYSGNGDQSGRRAFPVIFSPRMGINFAPDNFVAFYASAGHGFSLPSPEETLLPAGDVNPGIKPEQGFQYEAGFRLKLPVRNIAMDATLYRIELNDLLVTKRLTEDIFTGINAGKTHHEGIELLLRNSLFEMERFPGILSSSVSYTWSVNRFIDFTDNNIVYDGNSLPGIPGQVLHVQFLWTPVRALEVAANLEYTGDQYLNDSNTVDYGGYFLSDIKATFRFKIPIAEFKLYSGINNLSDTHYASMVVVNALSLNNMEPRYYYPGLPRYYYAGLQIDFLPPTP